MVQPVAPLFPVGGPVPADLVIGRSDELARLLHQISHGVSTLVTGPRRIGKTTVCDEVCRRLVAEHGALAVKIDVPERIGGDATALLQAIVDATAGLRIPDAGGVLRVVRPTIEEWLKREGIPVDLSSVGRPAALTMREIVSLPLRVAHQHGRRVLVFFDELQRAVDYVDGHSVLTDIRDIYSGAREQAVVLIDGSDERTIDQLLDSPVGLGKLVSRYELPTTIAAHIWQEPLIDRFAEIDKRLAPDQRDAIIEFGAGRPYHTMVAARYVALAASGHEGQEISGFDIDLGLDHARQHLRDDDA